MIAIQPDDPPREALQIVHRGIDRLIEAVREGNELVIETLQPMLNAHYPSQIFQAITDGPLLAAVLVLMWLRPRKPGVITGTFLVSYGVLRIGTEVYRQPDTGVALLLGL
jgi:phosphatidylglycerol---prolipoprotein diacylglyceryl transferase